jgi:hypothetical protein
MSIDFTKARDFVYANGVLWERDLFATLFEKGTLERLHTSLGAYRNADGGFGNALEHDIRCTQSHPLALEFLLATLTQHDLPAGDLLDGASAWLERNRQPDGSLVNPPQVFEYPHAPWWDGGGQDKPDSITGNLIRYGKASRDLRESTMQWVKNNLTLDHICANEWLFMAYHGYDYYFNELDFPDSERYRAAVIENIIDCAQKAPEKQFYSLFRFAPTPDSPVAQAMPPALLNQYLDHLSTSQQDDGGWNDEHGLPQWRPMVTITNLYILRNYGRQIM